MDVTKDNFAKMLPLIQKSIETADYIAFDTEFSGLNVGFEDKQHDYDTIEDRYQKLIHNCKRMNTFQIGICTFKWIEEKGKYCARPFNFYVFPDSKIIDTGVLQFQASCIKFLRDHTFDFNKLFTEGISYQKLAKRDEVERKVIEKLNNESGQSFQRYFMSTGPTSQSQLPALLKQVDEFVELTLNSDQTETKTLKIESFALRKLLAREVYGKYKHLNIIFTEHKKESDNFIIKKWKKRMTNLTGPSATGDDKQKEEAKQSNPEDNKAATDQQQQVVAGLTQDLQNLTLQSDSQASTQINTSSAQSQESEQIQKIEVVKSKEELQQDMITNEMGFSLIVQMLIDAKKPLIGHNMMYDIIYLYGQFIDDLPETYQEFITRWHSQFPYVFDNKVLAYAADYFGKNELDYVYNKCVKDTRLKFTCMISFDESNELNKYADSSVESKHHEAAFDAYMTGYCIPFILKYKDKPAHNRQFNNNNNPNQNKQHEGTNTQDQSQEVKRNFGKPKQQFHKNNNPNQKKKNEEEEKVMGQEGGQQQPWNLTEGDKKKKVPANLQGEYAKKYLNKVMLNQYDGGRMFSLDPAVHASTNDKNFGDIAWLSFDKSIEQIGGIEHLARLFEEYGDFNTFKDSDNSCFIEFFFYEPNKVHTKTIVEFVKIVNESKNKFGIKAACLYNEASKFKAHNRIM